MEIEINTFEDLIEVIENNNLCEQDRNEVVRQCLKVIVIGSISKIELIKQLKEYWSKYSNKIERPIFLNVDLSIFEFDS